jgi:biopolymer transport protein ExbD
MNLTPMIDVTFQLIVFFLLTLSFHSIDHRIDSVLPKEGQLAAPALVPDVQPIRVKLFRREKHDPERAHTLIRLNDGASDLRLAPGPWPGAAQPAERAARLRADDEVFAALASRIARSWERQRRSPDVEGRIAVPPPDGPSVPHGDVVRVLDAFLAAGMTNVEFEGATDPTMSAR